MVTGDLLSARQKAMRRRQDGGLSNQVSNVSFYFPVHPVRDTSRFLLQWIGVGMIIMNNYRKETEIYRYET